MKLKKLILFQLLLFLGLAAMIAYERNEECKQDAAKESKKIDFSHYSVTSTTPLTK